MLSSHLRSYSPCPTTAMDLVLPRLGIQTGPIWGAGPPKQFAGAHVVRLAWALLH